MSDKPVIFISYSHKDEPDNPRGDEVAWLSFVRTYLQPAIKNGVFDLWVDRHMVGGADWDPEIEEKLRACDIFILLVSANSMASDYIVDKEIAIIRERQGKGEPVHFYPLLLTPTPETGLEKVKDKNLRPRDARPFSGFPLHERMQHMTDAANEIGQIAKEISDRNAARQPVKTIPHPAYVHITGLPETAYERLVGRDDEIERLDHAWVNPTINIVSLVAEGGAGKSALVNEWLRRLQAENYRAAETVLGWSFYNQGTKERATSADEFLNWIIARLGISLSTTNASAKAEAVAEAMMQRRILLLLDGLEPLQHGLDVRLGELKDIGMRALLRRFAGAPSNEAHGLIVLTTRLAVKDLGHWLDSAAPVFKIERLSDEAGAALLRDVGVWGTKKELRATTNDFGGHPLALGLLGCFLKETQAGDARRRDHVRAYLADTENPLHDHARRVMESYEQEWLVGQPALLAIMYVIGLFDRPASEGCLRALRQNPAVAGFMSRISGLSEIEWQRAVNRLREGHLLSPADESSPKTLDAHPLVREWFGEKLRTTDEQTWKLANSCLYEFLIGLVRDKRYQTLQELGPIYQAIPHGCRAGRHEEVLEKAFRHRLSRIKPDGSDQFYTYLQLGATNSDLAAISWFFDLPFERPISSLSINNQRWLLSTAALYLLSSGRLDEAQTALESAFKTGAMDFDEHLQTTSRLVNVAVTKGDLKYAGEIWHQGLALLRQDRSNKRLLAAALGMQCNVFVASGEFDLARRDLIEASQLRAQIAGGRQGGEVRPDPASVELMLMARDYLGAYRRASRGLRMSGLSTLFIRAIFCWLVARSSFGLAFAKALESTSSIRDREVREYAMAARSQLDEAIERLRLTGREDQVPLGYLSRSAFRRNTGDWDAASRDIAEVEEIADVRPAPMRLHLCEMALERARLALAKTEAFAPLNGMLEKDNPEPPKELSDEEKAKLRAEAAEQIGKARKLIDECGYHRRDEELVELKEVLAGTKTFASLPPRV